MKLPGKLVQPTDEFQAQTETVSKTQRGKKEKITNMDLYIHTSGNIERTAV